MLLCLYRIRSSLADAAHAGALVPSSVMKSPERRTDAKAQGDGDMLSRAATLVFIVLPVIAVALAVAVVVIIALGWVIQHLIG
jgi:hypothetical protein